jgi:transcriptional regulator with PAS, ATPase and Fis domain
MIQFIKEILDYIKIPVAIIQENEIIFENINFREIFQANSNVYEYIFKGVTRFTDERGVKFYIKRFENPNIDFQVFFIVDFVKNQVVSRLFSSIEGVLSLHTLINNPYEGMVLIDKNGKIKYINSLNERFFKVKLSKIKNKHVTKLIPNTRLHLVAKSGKEEIGKLQKIDGEPRIVSRIPVSYKNKVYGAIGKIILKNTKEIEELIEELKKLKDEIKKYKNQIATLHHAQYTFNDIIGSSPNFLEAKNFAKKIAPTDSTVILLGESGTGKELFAHAIHLDSQRKNNPFVKVNCASIPSELAESELFGYTEGAFTGALRYGKPGKFELANGGTIFLDEIGDMPLSLQAKLLRVIQEKEVERIGKSTPQKVDFRLICATNKNLKKLVEKNQFREDLYYRIYTVPIKIPPLRERKEDIEKLAYHFLNLLSKYTKVKEIDPQFINILRAYSWPGNIRELKNVIELSIYRSTDEILTPKSLPSYIFENLESFEEKLDISDYENTMNRLKDELEKKEREIIIRALKITNGNKTKTAELLGIHRTGLHKKLNKYKIKL